MCSKGKGNREHEGQKTVQGQFKQYNCVAEGNRVQQGQVQVQGQFELYNWVSQMSRHWV